MQFYDFRHFIGFYHGMWKWVNVWNWGYVNYYNNCEIIVLLPSMFYLAILRPFHLILRYAQKCVKRIPLRNSNEFMAKFAHKICSFLQTFGSINTHYTTKHEMTWFAMCITQCVNTFPKRNYDKINHKISNFR